MPAPEPEARQLTGEADCGDLGKPEAGGAGPSSACPGPGATVGCSLLGAWLVTQPEEHGVSWLVAPRTLWIEHRRETPL